VNDKLESFARKYLKKELPKCTNEEQYIFKRMYSNENLDMNINDVVDKMDADKLDWAMSQVARTMKMTQEKK